MTSIWSDDWKSRIQSRLEVWGYESLHAFVADKPTASFGEIYRLLRNTEGHTSDDIAYIQINRLFFDEALGCNRLKEAVTDTLVRSFRSNAATGFGNGAQSRKRRMRVFASWELPTHLDGFDQFALEVSTIFDREVPPDDWCPEDAHDPILCGAVNRAWKFCFSVS